VPISGNVTYHLRSANEGNTYIIMYDINNYLGVYIDITHTPLVDVNY